MSLIAVREIDDPRLAPYRDLTNRNLTRHSGLFIAEGEKVVHRLIESDFEVASILAESALAERYASTVPAATPIYVSAKELLQETVGFHFHRGIVACGRRQPPRRIKELLATAPAIERATLLICPDVQDPTNLGSIIRSAAAFGCAGVVLGRGCADAFSRRVLRVSMGAALQIPMVEGAELGGDLAQLRAADYELFAAVLDASAEPLSTARRHQRSAILLGSEGHGLSPEWISRCDRRVTIPMELGVDSLNVAVAAAVLLYHFTHEE